MMTEIWICILSEAQKISATEPIVKRLVDLHIVGKPNIWAVLSSVLAQKLSGNDWSKEELEEVFYPALSKNKALQASILADLKAYRDRDYACENYLEVIFFYRGFQAITACRIAQGFYKKEQKLTAKFFQNRIAEIYAVDIHPNAKLGKGIVVDHGIGLVVGETAEIGDYAFIFHQVTLGGTGHHGGDRHPKVKNNVFIGAGAILLGNITINNDVNIAAGSVVVKDVPPKTTVAGVPAKPIGEAKKLQ